MPKVQLERPPNHHFRRKFNIFLATTRTKLPLRMHQNMPFQVKISIPSGEGANPLPTLHPSNLQAFRIRSCVPPENSSQIYATVSVSSANTGQVSVALSALVLAIALTTDQPVKPVVSRQVCKNDSEAKINSHNAPWSNKSQTEMFSAVALTVLSNCPMARSDNGRPRPFYIVCVEQERAPKLLEA